MWKLIFKNLWSRRKRNGWIVVELIVVTIVLFVLVDKMAVSLYDSSLPLGYDADRLCVVSMKAYNNKSPRFNKERWDSASRVDDAFFLINKIKSIPEVENVTAVPWSYINGIGGSSNAMFSGNKERDSINLVNCIFYQFVPGLNYFETYGIKSVEGSPSAEELSKMSYAPMDIVVTKTYVDLFYPGENVIGKKVFHADPDKPDRWKYRVVGVVDGVRFKSYERTNCLAFMPYDGYYFYYTCEAIVRLKPGVDMDDFVADFKKNRIPEMKAGNFYATGIKSYEDIIADQEQNDGITSPRQLSSVLMIFFLVNLCLGVIGTFWLQTRNRTEEAGIMRSFGAKRWTIRWMLLGEGFVLSTISVIIGCLVYLQVALDRGLEEGYKSFFHLNKIDTWITHFGEHFIIISLLCYVVIMITVLIGIYLPARNISNVEPIDALRNE